MKHIAPISGVACVSGSLVATAGYDNQVILWDARTHGAIGRVHHDHLANQCAFSADGSLLASASSDYSARIWSVPSMRLKAVLGGHEDDVEMVAFSPDGAKLATCSRDKKVRIFDTEGRLLQTCTGHGADVISVSWMPNGEEIISSSDDGTVRRWRVADGGEVSCVHFDDVETDTLVVTEDGLVIAGDDEGRISLIDGDRPIRTVAAHDAGIKRLVYSPLTRQLVSLSYDRTMKLWAVADNDLSVVSEAPLPRMIWPRSCAFLTDRRIAFATFGSTYALFDIDSGQWSLPGYEPSLSINSVLRNDEGLYTIGDSGILRLNNGFVADMNGLCNFLVECGTGLLSGGQMGIVHDARTGRPVHQHHSPLNCGCAFLKDGVPHVAIGSYTGEAIILRETGGKIEFVQLVDMHKNAIKGLATDGDTIIGVSADRATALVSVDSLETIARWDDGHTQIANGCAVIEPGLYCSISRDLKVRVWDGAGCKQTIPGPHKNSMKCVAATPRMIAVGDYGGRIGVYDRARSTWLNMVRPTTWGISSIMADRDGGFLASSYDGNVYKVEVDGDAVRFSLAMPTPRPEPIAKVA